ncbi:hypothetical protein HD554DRAFT_2113568 [Boletus coccyginus]|nr:hypothetical protein HD554DRAFT_2113568 [Boletus coccyginus]
MKMLAFRGIPGRLPFSPGLVPAACYASKMRLVAQRSSWHMYLLAAPCRGTTLSEDALQLISTTIDTGPASCIPLSQVLICPGLDVLGFQRATAIAGVVSVLTALYKSTGRFPVPMVNPLSVPVHRLVISGKSPYLLPIDGQPPASVSAH